MNRTILMILVLALLSGCTVVQPVEPEKGHYYLNPAADFEGIGKIVLLELENQTLQPGLERPVTLALQQAIQKRHLFSVSVVWKDDPTWRNLDVTAGPHYSLEQMARMRQEIGVDSIVFGSIIQHASYPHMATGLHIKMLDLKEGRVLWGLEQLWDSTDYRTERRMQAYYESEMRRDSYQPLEHRILYTSPRAFHQFIAWEIARTLPQTGGYGRSLSSQKGGDFKKNETILKKTQRIPAETLKFADEASTIRL